MSGNTRVSTPESDVHTSEPVEARCVKLIALKNDKNNANSPMHIVEVRACPVSGKA